MFDRKKQLRWATLKVSMVITISIIVLVLVVFFAGGLEELFVPRAEIKAVIKDVKGLRKGAPVWVSGIEVGYVKKIRLDPQQGTIVYLSIRKSALASLREDTSASVMTMGLLGDKFIELSPGTSEAKPINAGQFITGVPQTEITDLIEASGESLKTMNSVVKKLDSLLARIDQGEGTVAKFLADPGVYNNLKETTRSLAVIIRKIEKAHGTAELLIEDPALYHEMKKAATNLSDASSDIAAFGKKLNTKSGTLQRLAEDPALYENLNAASEQLSVLLNRIEKGEGVAGSLVRDEALAKDLRETVVELKALSAELKVLVEDIRENPGRYFKFSLF